MKLGRGRISGVHDDRSSSLGWTYVFAGAKLDATYNRADTYFALSDWLGTKRVEVDAAGACATGYRSLPFGEQLAPAAVTVGGVAMPVCSTDATEHHFTGKEHDAETGNDYFGARYFNSGMGRWLSPDWSAKEEPVPYAKLDDPQTLNLYTYVLDDPMRLTDGDGHDEGILRQIADIIEVSYSEGVGAHVEFQCSRQIHVEGSLGPRVESSIGLGGGNKKVKVFAGGEIKAKVGPLEGNGNLGGTLSSEDGASLGGSAHVKAGAFTAGGGVALTRDGIKSGAEVGLESSKDSKFGIHIQAVEGVGAAINFSQASRVAHTIWGAMKSAVQSGFQPTVKPPTATNKPNQNHPY